MRRFPGTIIIVSHDRHILNQLVTEVIEVGRGHAIRYLGNYDDYLAKKASEEAGRSAALATRAVAASASAAPVSNGGPLTAQVPSAMATENRGANGDGARQRPGRNDGARNVDRGAQRAKSRTAKQRAELEARIEKHESERAALALEMNDPNFYLARKDANDMIARYDWLGREIERLYDQLVNFEQPQAH